MERVHGNMLCTCSEYCPAIQGMGDATTVDKAIAVKDYCLYIVNDRQKMSKRKFETSVTIIADG